MPSLPQAPDANYTEIIRAFLDARRRTHPRAWSVRAWSRRLGLRSSGALVNILKRRAVPSPTLARKFATSMELAPAQEDLFRTLVEEERALRAETPDPEHIRVLSTRVAGLRIQAGTRLVEDARLRPISFPLWLGIREFVNLFDFREDPAWIRARLQTDVSQSEIAEALRTLESSGLLQRDRDGRLALSERYYDTVRDVPSATVRRFHDRAARLAQKMLRVAPVERRDYSATFLTLSRARLPELKARIREFRDQLIGEFDTIDGRGDEVYQMNVQLFPLTRSPPNDKPAPTRERTDSK